MYDMSAGARVEVGRDFVWCCGGVWVSGMWCWGGMSCCTVVVCEWHVVLGVVWVGDRWRWSSRLGVVGW